MLRYLFFNFPCLVIESSFRKVFVASRTLQDFSAAVQLTSSLLDSSVPGGQPIVYNAQKLSFRLHK